MPMATPSLDPKAFHILVVLAEDAAHGYAIRQQVEARTDGAIRLWPATLYGTLADLSVRGWIQESKARRPGDDPRRIYYAITADGRRVLAAEAARLASLARLARAKLDARRSS